MIRLSRGTYFGSLRATHSVPGLRISENTYRPHERIPLHVHAHPFLCLVIAGGFIESSGRRSAECPTGTVIWHPEGEPHQDHFGGGGAVCVGLDFDGDLVERLGEGKLLPRERTSARGGAVTWFASRIARELSQPDGAFPLAMEGLTYALVAELSRVRGAPGRKPVWLERGAARLRAEFRSPPSVAELSDDAGVHRGHYVRVFHRYMGCTIGEYVRRVRIDWACEMVRRAEGPSLAEIALQAGFADQPHFTRTFKRITGLTPRDFRRRHARY